VIGTPEDDSTRTNTAASSDYRYITVFIWESKGKIEESGGGGEWGRG
jgi:hypothetical protein